MEIKKIVLTGGPCAGKTTILKILQTYLSKKGYYVITVPETATEMISNKILPVEGKEATLEFQNMVLCQQYTKEKIAEEYAKKIVKEKNVVILYDRGINDNRAYLESQEDFRNLLKNNNLDEYNILNNYNLVIYLVSVATKQKDNYENDEIRFESPEEAIVLDEKTANAWCHHDNFEIVEPTETIDDKITQVLNITSNFLEEKNDRKTDKIRLKNTTDLSFYNEDNSKTIDIAKIYLDEDYILTRKSYNGTNIYSISKKDGSYFLELNSQQFIDYIYHENILDTEIIKEILFVKNGKLYKIIINKKYDSIDLEKESNNKIIPDNLVPYNIQKGFSKIKKYGNI